MSKDTRRSKGEAISLDGRVGSSKGSLEAKRDIAFSTFTLKAVEAAVEKALRNRPSPDAEFLRPGDFRSIFGLSRSMVYQLEERGVIRTICLRRQGTIRGIKLVDVGSVRQFLIGHYDDKGR